MSADTQCNAGTDPAITDGLFTTKEAPPRFTIERCVLFHEAVWWIACRNFAGPSAGPILVSDRENAFEEEIDEQRASYDFAQKLLLDFAARSKIRLYGTAEEYEQRECRLLPDDQNLSKVGYLSRHELEISPEFIARAEIEYTDDGLATLYWLSEDNEDGERYEAVAANYTDLISNFWGENSSNRSGVRSTSLDVNVPPTPQPTLKTRASPTGKRRGPPMIHGWPAFVAETTRRCLARPKAELRIQGAQAALEKEMLEWCAENWPREPVLSEVRKWVAPIVKSFAGGPEREADKSQL